MDERQHKVEDAVVVQIASDEVGVIDAVEPAYVAVSAAIASPVSIGRDPQVGMAPEEFVDGGLLLRGEDIVVRLGLRGDAGSGERERTIGLNLRERPRGLSATARGETSRENGRERDRDRPGQ